MSSFDVVQQHALSLVRSDLLFSICRPIIFWTTEGITLAEVNQYGDILRISHMEGTPSDGTVIRIVVVPYRGRVFPNVAYHRFQHLEGRLPFSEYGSSQVSVYYNLRRPFYRRDGLLTDAETDQPLPRLIVVDELYELSSREFQIDMILIDQPSLGRLYLYDIEGNQADRVEYPPNPNLEFKVFPLYGTQNNPRYLEFLRRIPSDRSRPFPERLPLRTLSRQAGILDLPAYREGLDSGLVNEILSVVDRPRNNNTTVSSAGFSTYIPSAANDRLGAYLNRRQQVEGLREPAVRELVVERYFNPPEPIVNEHQIGPYVRISPEKYSQIEDQIVRVDTTPGFPTTEKGRFITTITKEKFFLPEE